MQIPNEESLQRTSLHFGVETKLYWKEHLTCLEKTILMKQPK
jgi:hypothetical protein